jgi:predicted nucleic acid-binding Zn ribbon protein
VSRRAQPRPLADSIRAVRSAAEPATLLAAVQGCWEQAVGERIAAQARPVREREGTITIECRASTWAQELDLLQDELLARVNEALGEPRVRGLRAIVGEGFDRESS